MEFDGKGTPVAMPVGMTDEDAEAYNALRALEERRKVRRRNKIIKTIAVLAAVAVGVGIWYFVTHAPQPEEEEEYIPETAVVTREDFSTSIQGSGTLQAASMSTVNPGVEGELNEMLVSEGDYVEKGQVLYTLTSEDIDSAIEEAGEGVSDAEKDLSEARKALKSAQTKQKKAKSKYTSKKKKYDAQVEKAQRYYDKAYKKEYDKRIAEIPATATEAEKKKLTAEAREEADKAGQRAQHQVSIPDTEEIAELREEALGYEEEIESAKGAVEEAREALSAAQEAYSKAGSGRDKLTVTSPQSGTVVSVSGSNSSSADEEADTSSVVVKVADMSSMKVSVQVNENEISTVKTGQRAKVTFQAFPDLELEAEVTKIASMANGAEESFDYEGNVVTFRVDLVIAHPDERLKPGMTAKVDILTQDFPNVLVIPPSALIEEDDGTYVDLVTNEETYETEHRKVKIGAQNQSQVIIKKGLKEDDVVISGGDDYGDMEDDEDYDEELDEYFDEDFDEGFDEDFEMMDEE